MSNELVHAQRMMLEVATRRRPALIAAQVVGASQWFAALKAIAMLVRLGMPEVLPLLDAMSPDARRAMATEAVVRRWNRAGSAGRFGMIPQTALVAAGLLAVALHVVAAEREWELAARLKPLAAAARIRWNGRHSDPLAELDLPSVFAEALDVLPRRGRRS
ncbi:hypothetical protein ACFQVD_30270 [Streptosporangium amethystogenes subsp. fukuiense]|uniref:Uncharacterized protein n=1 Tax=Streptosporangium amethystogenes subsp. fukuiense TaxID=698418 RepID=A0ABW2T800_9ACTN